MKTNIAVPPPLMTSVAFWERSSDPFHPNAFAGILEVFTKEAKQTSRDDGWMGIDWIGNPIGFISDGSEIEPHDVQYYLKESYPKRLCAVPETHLTGFANQIKLIQATKNESESK